jgi:tRNA(Ile)-lysidine synthase
MRSSVPAFLERVSATISAHRMVEAGQTVLVAFSGGPDSTALLHSLWRLRGRLHIALAACHVHHGLRGGAADADARHAQEFADSLSIRLIHKQFDVGTFARQRKLSQEAAAREVRYALLEEAAGSAGAGRIATGHTADDQAETVLMNLLRGAGTAGLAGMPRVRGKVIRPLLDVTREEAEAYCRAEGLAFRVDQSNLDLRLTRNRIRHQVMPMLRALQPNVVGALCRLAEIARGDEEVLGALGSAALAKAASPTPRGLELLCADLSALPLALQRRALRAAVAQVKGSQVDIEFERIEALVELANSGRTGAVVELPGGVVAARSHNALTVSLAGAKVPVPYGECTLPVPGLLAIPELGVAVSAEFSSSRGMTDDPSTAVVDADAICPPLMVRTWRPGDRFTPLGMEKPVKLQDFFVNASVRRELRPRIPLVLSADQIVWVAGLRISDHCKVTRRTKRTVLLGMKRLDWHSPYLDAICGEVNDGNRQV